MTDTIRVKVVSLGTNREVELPPGSTVEDALKIANLDENLEVRIGGSSVPASTALNGNETVVASAPQVKHG